MSGTALERRASPEEIRTGVRAYLRDCRRWRLESSARMALCVVWHGPSQKQAVTAVYEHLTGTET